jgi:hypothetical protein
MNTLVRVEAGMIRKYQFAIESMGFAERLFQFVEKQEQKDTTAQSMILK